MKRVLALLVLIAVSFSACSRVETGADVRYAFAQAKNGKPLRCVFLGGSITQSGNGWISDWLKQQFPQCAISVINSGMSATGSSLGIFRLERDVITYQPDLVAIEFCVNDGGLPDEDAIRYMETIIVRLKQLPRPPAIVILEAAAKDGVNLARHRRVAQHYHLAEVDLQQAVDARLKESGAPWETYFKDRVHPNDAGNVLYGEAIAKTLQAYLSKTENTSVASIDSSLPRPLSTKPLLLDARMIPLTNFINSWKRENSIPFWYSRFFQGVLSDDTPGAAVTFPVHGTTIGLLYALDKSYGSFFVSIDEGWPQVIATNNRGGYTSSLIGRDLPAGEHRLQVVLPSKVEGAATVNLNGPVKLGYVLVAGETQAATTVAPVGNYPASRIAQLRYTPLLPAQWTWSGPYQSSTIGAQAADALPLLETVFPPETKESVIDWKPLPPMDTAVIDFKKMTDSLPAVAYAQTEVQSATAREAILAIACDYYAKVWVNGALVQTINGSHSAPPSQVLCAIHLQPGSNKILVKSGSGAGGFNFSAGLWQ